jgi:2',3'-cyclic-nucleotide 2'-phosphodiesterase (5'-nucleotidase family)
MDFEISRLHVGAAVGLGIIIGVLQVQCESNQAHDEHPEAEQVVEMTPAERLARLDARGTVQAAHKAGLDASMREVNRRLNVMEKQREQKAPPADETDVLTVLFRANNHGEREDCGCKHNPLGGLARHQTLVDLASNAPSDDAKKWWGGELLAPDALFNVDAGDLLFRTASLDRQPEGMQKTAREQARAVVGALEASPPDVANVGEIDLVFGLDTYKELVSGAKFPIISANLYDANGDRPFEGHHVVSRGGKKVAFIGLLKPKPRVHDYWETRKVEVKPAKKAYVDELQKLPKDVDLVVLLSNLGMNDTTALVESLAKENARIDAGIVSNTNRLTRSPVWAAGVPLVEPLSRGKYFGRLDIRLGDEPGVSYANATADPREVVQDYRRAWSSYFGAHEQWRSTARQIAELEIQLETHRERARETDEKLAEKKAAKKDGAKEEGATEGANQEKGESEKYVDSTAEATESRIEFLTKKLTTFDKRIETSSKELARQTSQIGSIEDLVNYGDGDDWASARIVQVKIEIPEDKTVRRALDRLAKGKN